MCRQRRMKWQKIKRWRKYNSFLSLFKRFFGACTFVFFVFCLSVYMKRHKIIKDQKKKGVQLLFSFFVKCFLGGILWFFLALRMCRWRCRCIKETKHRGATFWSFQFVISYLFGLGGKKSSPLAIMINIEISNCQFWPWISSPLTILYGLHETLIPNFRLGCIGDLYLPFKLALEFFISSFIWPWKKKFFSTCHFT